MGRNTTGSQRRRYLLNGWIRTGPLATFDEVDGAPAQGRWPEDVPVRELHGGPGEAEHDQGDEQQAELLQHAVGGHARGSGRGLTRCRGGHRSGYVSCCCCCCCCCFCRKKRKRGRVKHTAKI